MDDVSGLGQAVKQARPFQQGKNETTYSSVQGTYVLGELLETPPALRATYTGGNAYLTPTNLPRPIPSSVVNGNGARARESG